MKLASFSTHEGQSFGVVRDGSVFDLRKRLDGRFADLKALIAANAFDEARCVSSTGRGDYPLSEVTLEPVIPNPEQIFCVGLNYAEHVKETNRETTENPVIFMRVPASQVGAGEPMLRPRESTQFDYEGEIAVIIGRGGAASPKLTHGITSRAIAATTMGPFATGSATRASGDRERTSLARAHSARGWSRATRSNRTRG
jgi:2-keto-4-pentenoate hydratase/2-oxohepta-3-ene-1,7-dioic acid hydratase in catechol pathway